MFDLINQILKEQEAINEREKQYEKNNAKSLEEMLAEQIREILELKWRKEDILKYIKERHWVDSEPAEVDGYKWKNIHINIPNIPAMKNFEWLNLDFFVSDDWVIEKTLHKNQN